MKRSAASGRNGSDVPQVWHYGLVARWWAEFNTDGPEIEYFRRKIAAYGEPVLDVGCGAGRLLLPYLGAGLDVDGCDISADMLELCRERAAAVGLATNLSTRPRTSSTCRGATRASSCAVGSVLAAHVLTTRRR